MSFQYSDNYVQRPRPQMPAPEEPVYQPEDPQDDEYEQHEEHHHIEPESTKKEYYKFAGIIGVILACATIMSTVVGFDWQEWMRWFMGGFFIFFGSFKLIGYDMFINMFPLYDPIGKRNKYYTWVYPFIEIFLGALYCMNLGSLPRDLVTFVIMSVGAYGVLKVIPRGGEVVRCACLGNIIKLPLSTVTLVENAGMAVMALTMVISNFVS